MICLFLNRRLSAILITENIWLWATMSERKEMWQKKKEQEKEEISEIKQEPSVSPEDMRYMKRSHPAGEKSGSFGRCPYRLRYRLSGQDHWPWL